MSDVPGIVLLATPAPVSHRTAEENLGLGYLAGALRRSGQSVRIIDAWLGDLSPERLAQRVLESPDPLMLGFACYRSNMAAAIRTVELLRAARTEVPIVAGGFGPTFHAEEFLAAGFDVAVRGEGEQTLTELVAHFSTGRPRLADIAGIAYTGQTGVHHTSPRSAAPDLDQLAWPAR